MIHTFGISVLVLVQLVGAPPTEAPKEMSALELSVRKAFNAGGARIDRCSARYIQEKPNGAGEVSVALQISLDGKVKNAKATSALPQARDLLPCIETAVSDLSFPKPAQERTLRLKVKVEKGAKFRLPLPSDPKPKIPKPKKKPDAERYFRFSPVGW